MGYKYEIEKPKILTDEGQRIFLKVRDRVHRLLDEAGAVMLHCAIKGETGDGWTLMAYVDRMVELGEIKEITNAQVAGQHRVFVSLKASN